MDDKTIYIIDGYGFIFRAFYAVPNFKTKDNIPVGAVYGFFKMLISLINFAKPEYVVVALDTGKRTFRNDIYDSFLEEKALKDIFANDEYKERFNSINLDLDKINKLTVDELAKELFVSNDEILEVCNKYNLDSNCISKMLVILIFLGLVDDLKIENCKTQYKSNRKETPDDLKCQFKIIRELIDSMGIKTESKVGFEADDIISTITKQAVDNGYKTIIVSADKDLCQLVKDDQVSIYDPVKKHFLNEKAVIERFGVRADQVCDFLSITGDHCDNVFGVNGIGPKGAAKLLEKYEHLENILLHINELEEKIRQKFLASKDVLGLAYKLINLCNDAIEIDDFEQYKLNINSDGLRNFIEKYDFKLFDSFQRKNNFNSSKKNNANDSDKKELEEKKLEQKSLFN